MSVLRGLWPPAGRRIGLKQEILTWLGSGWPDNDDAAMMKAQAEGVRMRAYHEWLAREEERMEEARRQMSMEDRQSWINRAILRETEEQMLRNQKRAIQLLKLMNGDDDDDDEDGDDRSSEHNSAIAEEEGEGVEGEHQDQEEEEAGMEKQEVVEAENDDILMINMDNGHADMKYDDEDDVV
eukprot:gene37291-50328_t